MIVACSRNRLAVCGRIAVGVCLVLGGCERSPFDRTKNGLEEAEQKQAARDFKGAISSYEKALDGTAKTAETHFRMGLIYAEKLDDPRGAIYEFRRYTELSPKGGHVAEAKANLDRLELTLATNLAGGTLIGHREAMRLKTENIDLRKQIAELNSPSPTGAGSNAVAAAGKPGTGGAAERRLAPGSRTYQVQPGDTLASISRKFYKTKVRARDIQDANLNSVPSATRLKPGQTLIIP